MNTYEIILGRKNGLFKINLGKVHTKDRRTAEKIGRDWCDKIGRSQWKRKISVSKKSK